MKKSSTHNLLFVLLVAAAVVAVTFRTLFLHPNTTLLSIGGDGIKNYFTSLFYLKYNNGTHFTGMNYPFGEHISFADAQPALVYAIKAITRIVPALAAYHLALFNLFLLAGMVAGVVFTYLLLRQLGAHHPAAVAGALCIAFFSPQLLRAEAHYGLSYLFSFTGAWYLFLRAENNPNWRNTLMAVAFITFCGLLHMYLAVLSVLFLAGYNLLKTVFAYKTEPAQLHAVRWIIAVLPVLFLQLYIRFTDYITDRPSTPWGFLTARTHLRHLIQPLPSDLLQSTTTPYRLYEEGFAYAGASVLLITGVLIVGTLFFRSKKLYPRQVSVHFAYSALALLLLAMGIPFIFHLEWLADYTGPLRQFRALGRFSWAYYYVAATLTAVALSKWWQLSAGRQPRILYRSFIVGVFLLWFAETGWRLYRISDWDYHAGRNYMLFMANDYGSLLRKNGIAPHRFQAILPLPYHHIGSEKFALDNWPAPWYGMKASLHTGLPGMQVMLSRTSYQQTTRLLQLTGDTLLQKEIPPHLAPNKPLLLLTYNNATLTKEEQRLVQMARFLCTDGEVQFYELPLQLFKNATNFEQWQRLAPAVVRQPFVAQYALPTGANDFTDAHFINKNSSGPVVVFDSTLNLFQPGDTVQVSLWLLPDLQKDVLPILQATVRHNESIRARFEFPAKFSRNCYRNLVQTGGTFVWPATGNRLKLQLHTGASFGNLLVRRYADTIIQSVSNNLLLVNNIPVQR
jgi:hypothetical protein